MFVITLRQSVYLLAIFGLCLLAFAYPNKASAYDSFKGHQELMRLSIERWNLEHRQQITSLEAAQLLEGASQEDKPEWRSLNHFFNPFGEGLELLPGWPVGQSLPDWAQSQDEVVFARNASWQQAKSLYLQGRRAEAFLTLGSLLHLIADAGLPAHVRNDEHLFGDGYERWVKERLSSQRSLLLDNLATLPASRCADYEACLREMAVFTNRHCFSDDSINNQLFYQPFDGLSLGADGYAYFDGQLVAAYDFDSGRLSLDEKVYLAYWRLLAPRIIANSQSVLTRFFEEVGQPQVVATKDKSQKPGRIASGVKIVGTETNPWQPPVVDQSLGIPAAFLAPPAATFVPATVSVPTANQSAPAESKPVIVTSSAVFGTCSSGAASEEPIAVPESEAVPEIEEVVGASSPAAASPSTTLASSSVSSSLSVATSSATTSPSTTTASGMDSASSSEVLPARFSGLSEALFGLWHFNEGQGIWSAAAVGGPAQNYATWTTGRWGYGFRQDALSESHSLAGQLTRTPTVPLTIAVWFRDDGQCQACYARTLLRLEMVGETRHLGFAPTVNYVDYYTGTYGHRFIAGVPNDQAWHQVVMVYGEQDLSLYIDGQLKEVKTDYDKIEGLLRDFYFVGENGPSEFDELALWSRALSAKEIADWYESGLELAP